MENTHVAESANDWYIDDSGIRLLTPHVCQLFLLVHVCPVCVYTLTDGLRQGIIPVKTYTYVHTLTHTHTHSTIAKVVDENREGGELTSARRSKLLRRWYSSRGTRLASWLRVNWR